jgi:hypothetical protein
MIVLRRELWQNEAKMANHFNAPVGGSRLLHQLAHP